MADIEKVIKPVKGYEGYYEVDNTGKVFSVEREIIVNGLCIREVKTEWT